jgi:hypothetical protein
MYLFLEATEGEERCTNISVLAVSFGRMRIIALEIGRRIPVQFVGKKYG